VPAKDSADWSKEEVEATVADYFAMLAAELSGIAYSKAEHRRRLISLLRDRSQQSIEFKHANISAVLIDLEFPYIAGYKPRSNYQGLLHRTIAERLTSDQQLVRLAAADAEKTILAPQVENILTALTDPPRPAISSQRLSDKIAQYSPLPVNYLEREARNRALGLAGEEFVIRFEQARLTSLNRERLASKIQHVSRTRGDAEGFDVLSFEATGAERLIEVKTTKYGRDTPFFISRHELDTSESRSERYHLYRLFEFRQSPKLFTMQGALSSTCKLNPASYHARVK
jgi:hypothetical protein